MSNVIEIDGLPFDAEVGQPLSFYGVLSGKELPGIDLSFHLDDPEDIETVERLNAQETVQVSDPFIGQTYPASFRRILHSYTQGRPVHSFACEIRAIDLAPEFKVLEILGEQYSVLASYEQAVTEQGQKGISRSILLQLTSDQFVKVQSLLNQSELSIRRVGVDEISLLVRPGFSMFWSEHVESGVTFYKQIVRLIYPANFPPQGPILALKIERDILYQMVVRLSARFYRLADELVETGAISDEKRTLLLQDKLFGDNGNVPLGERSVREIEKQRYCVADAQKELEEEIAVAQQLINIIMAHLVEESSVHEA
jgi:hypothetical protein